MKWYEFEGSETYAASFLAESGSSVVLSLLTSIFRAQHLASHSYGSSLAYVGIQTRAMSEIVLNNGTSEMGANSYLINLVIVLPAVIILFCRCPDCAEIWLVTTSGIVRGIAIKSIRTLKQDLLGCNI